ncbi:hypothetical protein [Actinoplanes sp. NPDC089786]|uniref:hypothetical protein n=1 Tax=Actinoplanes sp. NPDC089786 TaxID=3155185 RepID=UPI00343F8C3A
MGVRLAGGVVPPGGCGLWLAGPAGEPVALDNSVAGRTPPGAPVALGAAGATPDRVAAAVRALGNLVAAGGRLAAGAEVDLGHGFRSALLDGGRGDRRDAMLAALTTDPSALGAREAIVTALFGPRVTRRVGAAAGRAVEDGRWGAVKLAAAASDVLGPEQLEQVLAWEAPEGIDPFGTGLASDAAVHLERLTRDLPEPRRLSLLADLWRVVGADRVRAGRAERLRASQDGHGLDDLREVYHRLDDVSALTWVAGHYDGEPRAAQLIRHTFPPYGWLSGARRLYQDSLAVTLMGRLAEDATATGLAGALRRYAAALRLVAKMPSDRAVKLARRIGKVPARPAVWVMEIVPTLTGELTPKKEAYVAARLARARDWGTILLGELAEFADGLRSLDAASAGELRAWGAEPMTEWRAAFGYVSPERLDGWGQPGHDRAPLAERRPAGGEERIDDLVWMAELGDQVARLHGRERAEVGFDDDYPTVDPLTGPAEARPIEAGPVEAGPVAYLSITTALTGAAHLAELGGVVPGKPRGWAELVAGLYGSADVSQALTGRFPVPEVLLAQDGQEVPGTGLRVEVATTPRHLAAYSDFMGNCLNGSYYTREAELGTCVVLALRAPDRRIVLNVELVRRFGHWRIDQFKARFNADPDPGQDKAVRAWVATLPVPQPTPPDVPDLPPPGARPMRTVRRPTPAERVVREVGPVLRRRLSGLEAPVLVRLAHALPEPPRTRGTEAVTALRRADDAELDEACRRAFRAGMTVRELWHGTDERPLGAAIRKMGTRIAPLARDEPLPGALRPLARLPEVRLARTVDVVSIRVRAALGRLVAAEDPALARGLAAGPDVPTLCAMALAATALGVGAPIRRERPEAWRAATPKELTGRPVPRGPLRAPANWNWPAVWARAQRNDS